MENWFAEKGKILLLLIALLVGFALFTKYAIRFTLYLLGRLNGRDRDV
jgi:hypothetical protein